MKNRNYDFRCFFIRLLFCVVGLILAASSFPSYAFLKGIPLPDTIDGNKCPPGSVDTWVGNACQPRTRSSVFGAGSTWTAQLDGGDVIGGFDQYVPVSSSYYLVTHICDASATSACTLAAAESEVISKRFLFISTSKNVMDQNLTFGGGEGPTINHKIMVCYTLRNSFGQDFGSPDNDMSCPDSHPLPAEPPICTLNGGADLDVDLGSMESTKIATSPDSSVAVNREVDIQCNGSGTLAGHFTFKFTSVSISGNNIIQTADPALGVALFYENQLVENGKNYSISVPKGGASVTLGFQAVKDNSKKPGGGYFTADAIMVLTQE